MVCVCYRLLAFYAVYTQSNRVSLCWSWSRPGRRRLKALGMILCFPDTFLKGKNPSFLSVSIGPPGVTINSGYFEIYNHVPRETGAFTLRKLVAVVESHGSCFIIVLKKLCLISRDLNSGEAMPDRWRLKTWLLGRWYQKFLGACQERLLGAMGASLSIV